MACPRGRAAIRIGFQALELGASSVYCSASRGSSKLMLAKAFLLSVTWNGSAHATWTNIRAIGKTAAEAKKSSTPTENSSKVQAPTRLNLNWSLTNSLLPLQENHAVPHVPRFRQWLAIPNFFSRMISSVIMTNAFPPCKSLQNFSRNINACKRAHRCFQGICPDVKNGHFPTQVISSKWMRRIKRAVEAIDRDAEV